MEVAFVVAPFYYALPVVDLDGNREDVLLQDRQNVNR